MSGPHWETLTPATRQTFHQVARLPFITNFYLAGGTGLALHLGIAFQWILIYFSLMRPQLAPISATHYAFC